MKLFILFFNFFIIITLHAQIASYNQFPTKRPSHILDEKLVDISFAYSMRILESDYEGPLVRLRRQSDNAEMDFGCTDTDIVDVAAINSWRGGANVFMVVWYDQSGLGRNAIQNTNANQPQFIPNIALPYFIGDGVNDFLDTQTSVQIVTDAGANGTVLMVLNGTTKRQNQFGVLVNNNRWLAHINWSDNNTYFDPGYCCNNPRSFGNASGVGVWSHYSFFREDLTSTARKNGVVEFSGAFANRRCTLNFNFTIGWARGNSGLYSNSSFNEMIMYSTDIPISDIQEIEENAMAFWGL